METTLLNLAKQHYQSAVQNSQDNKILPYGIRWSVFMDRMKEAIPHLQSIEAALSFSQSQISFTHRSAKYKIFWKLFEHNFLSNYPQFKFMLDDIEDTHLFGTDSLCGPKLNKSNLLYFHLENMCACLTENKSYQVIADIGSGYGELARLWMSNNYAKPKYCILIDSPESLFFAELFLGSHFGSDRICYIDTPAFNLKKNQGFDFLFCPINFLSCIKHEEIDLAINTGSMQEMSESWITFWMNWLDTTNVKYFYSLNYFFQPLSYLAEGANTMAPWLSPQWIIQCQNYNPFWVRVHTLRNYLQLFSVKNQSSPIQTSDLNYGKRLLQERRLDGNIFLEALDLYRRSGDFSFGLLLFKETYEKVSSTPKELYFLAQDFLNHRSEFTENQLNYIESVYKKLKLIRDAGIEGLL